MEFDTSPFTDNNKNINENNDKDEVVNLSDLKNINDPNCKHHFIKDYDELAEENNLQAWQCSKCKRGLFLKKHQIIVNS